MKLKLFAVALFASLFVGSTAYAAGSAAGTSNCQVVYGGGEVCNTPVKFTINKMVQTPGKGGGNFVDNLRINDARFVSGQDVNFKIAIQNTGNNDISNLNVVDSLPDFFTFKSGTGKFDSNARTLTWDTGKITVNQTLEYIVTLTVVSDDKLPSNQGVICLINTVRATENSGAVADDSSQTCVQKQVITTTTTTPTVFGQVPVKSIPSTGPELYSLIGLIPMGAAGIFLKKRSRG